MTIETQKNDNDVKHLSTSSDPTVLREQIQNISTGKMVQFYFSQTTKSLFQKNTLTIELKIDKVNAVAH